MYYLNSRYYDPELGRFINADNINYLNPNYINGLNLFAYCNNNPINYVDNNGNIALAILLALGIIGGGAIIGGVVAGKKAYDEGLRDWDLVGKVALGAFIGAATGGAFIALGSVIAGALGVTAILGATTAQLFAIGALTYNIFAFVIAPILGIEVEGIEFEKKNENNNESYPDVPGITTINSILILQKISTSIKSIFERRK